MSPLSEGPPNQAGSPHDVGGLVLAAGRGSRFGGALKQLAPFAGRPLIEHAVGAMRVALTGRVVVVLGYEAEKIAAGAALDGSEVVTCGDWYEGQAASLRCGLRALARGPRAVAAVIVTLGDQPLISPLSIERLISSRRQGDVALRASYGGRPGHPVLLEWPVVEAAMRLSGDQGARDLLVESNATLIACDDLGSDLDLDTEDDLRAAAGMHR